MNVCSDEASSRYVVVDGREMAWMICAIPTLAIHVNGRQWDTNCGSSSSEEDSNVEAVLNRSLSDVKLLSWC